MTLNRFQALTFRAADMYTSLELTRSIVTWATMVLADDDSDAEKKREAAARAKLQVSKAGRHIGQEAIQLHGGIGMTAEYAVGHLTARLTAIDHLLGDGRQQIKNLVAPADVVRRGRAAPLIFTRARSVILRTCPQMRCHLRARARIPRSVSDGGRWRRRRSVP